MNTKLHRSAQLLPPLVRGCVDAASVGEESRDTPLCALAAAMLARTYKDLVPDVNGKRSHETTERDEADALRWLSSNDSSYFLSAVNCCEWLGLSIKVVRKVIEEKRNESRRV